MFECLDLKTYLKNVDKVFSWIQSRQLDRLFSMRDSYKFVDRLVNCFQQKKSAIQRNRLQQKEAEEKASNSLKEEQQLKEKLNLLISYTKQLKEQVYLFLNLFFNKIVRFIQSSRLQKKYLRKNVKIVV